MMMKLLFEIIEQHSGERRLKPSLSYEKISICDKLWRLKKIDLTLSAHHVL